MCARIAGGRRKKKNSGYFDPFLKLAHIKILNIQYDCKYMTNRWKNFGTQNMCVPCCHYQNLTGEKTLIINKFIA